ncbi:uncharacterized protein LOC111630276 [Centruroides sculpturatus]|uniref:uncharacterized protein LOC111630276 n=1 Tax=Centruroides sculpturatus TaxID=218467 RepID=UPI000C6DBEEE|nr:uncharacterized protein LOC111630276 [Centruroides sculpturatus]
MPVNETPNNLKTSKHKSKTKKINNEKEVKTPVQVSENKIQYNNENVNLYLNHCLKIFQFLQARKQAFRFGFGDCRYPLLESAQLIEEIVHQQMNSLLLQSAEIANIRNSRFIGPEDIVFLMRKDKTKISRLLHYLSVKDTKNTITKNCGLEEEDIADTGVVGESKVQPRLKRAKLCQDFLNSISLIGGLYNKVEDEVVDEVKIEREIRADQQTANMDQNQYLEYSEARRASFGKSIIMFIFLSFIVIVILKYLFLNKLLIYLELLNLILIISRLLHYLSVKDTKNTITKNCGLEEEDIADTGVVGESKVQPRLKRAKLCQDFLNSISLIGGLYNKVEDEVVDEVKIEREIRADQQTANMDQNQYLEYSEARRASFARKYRSTKFRDWLLKDNLTEIKPNPIAIEIFHYLAYETVAQIVDLALLVKQDAQGSSCDPFTRLIPPVVYNPEYPNIQIAQNLKQCQILRPDSPSQIIIHPKIDFKLLFEKQIVDLALLVKQDAQGSSCDPFTRLIPPVVYNPEYPNIQIAQNLKQCQILRPDSPSQSPASPPSSPGSQDRPQHPSTSLNKPKPKKFRRSDGKSSYDLSGSRCIQPADIREAIRRYWKPSGPLMLFSKHHHNYLGTRLMCC